jgi:hypothetical protein
LSLYFEFVSFDLDEHFLFHGKVVLFDQLIILFVVLILKGIEFFDVFVEFLFVFLYSLVVHFVEVSFFEEFIVSGLCFF